MAERCRVVLVFERLGVRNRKQLEPGRLLQVGEGRCGLARHQDGGGDFPRLDLLDRLGVGEIDLLRVDAERREDQPSGNLRAAALGAEIHRFADELLDVVHLGAHQHVHLLVEQLGDISDAAPEIRTEIAGAVEMLEQIGLGDAHIDAAQIHDVLDVLLGSFSHHRQDAEIVAVVEHFGEVLDNRQVRAARASGHDRHHVLVDARAEILARALSGGDGGCGGSVVDFGVCPVREARRRHGGDGKQTQSASKGDTHDRPLFSARFFVTPTWPRLSAPTRGVAGNANGDGVFARVKGALVPQKSSTVPPIVPQSLLGKCDVIF